MCSLLNKTFQCIFHNFYYVLFIFRNEEYNKEILIDIAVDFVKIILDNKIYIKEDFAEEIILTFLTDSDIKMWMAEITEIIIYGEVITGELYVSSLEQKIQIHQKCISIDITCNTITDHVENCLKWALFNINLLNNLCLKFINEYETEKSSIEQFSIHDLNLPGIINILINIIYSIILGKMYSKYYKSVSN